MKKKILFVFLAVCLALPFAFVLSACSKKGNSIFVSKLEFKYNGEFNQWLNVEYEYGQTVDIFNGLEVWATYSDGSKKDITDKLKEENVKYYVFDEGQEREIDLIPSKPDVGYYGIKVKMSGQEIGVSIWISPVENPEGISFVVGGDNRYKYNEQDVTVEMRLNGVKENGNDFLLYYMTAEDYAANCQGKSVAEQVAYLKEYTMATETAGNNLTIEERDGGKYITYTGGLDNGQYYFFLHYYAFGNYDDGVTLPRAVTIAKGDFVLVNGATADISATYSFSTFELEGNVRLGNIEIVASDDITFLGEKATDVGCFKFVSEDTTIDGSNTSLWQIEYVFTNEDYAKNYDTSSFSRYIRPTLNKGVIERPYVSTGALDSNNKYVVTYNGNEHNYFGLIANGNAEYFDRFATVANGSQTNAGSYNLTLTLKNANNYEWGMPVNASDDYYYGELNGATVSFAWEIKKVDQSSGNYQQLHFIVGGEDSYSNEINWISGGEYTIRIIPDRIYPTNTTWTWEIVSQYDDSHVEKTVASLENATTSGFENTITFTEPGEVNIALSHIGDSNVNPLVYDGVYPAQVRVRKADLAHKTEIEADIAAVTAQTWELTATNGQVLVPDGMIPESNYDEGSWKLYNGEDELTVGDNTGFTSVTETEYPAYLTLKFVPDNEDCYNTISENIYFHIVAKDFENKSEIVASVQTSYIVDVDMLDINFENVRVPSIKPNDNFDGRGCWRIFEGEELQEGDTYSIGEACVKNWNLVFVSSSTLYNDVTVPVTVKFRGPVDDYDNIYAEIVQTSFEQELIGDSVVVTRASLLPVTTHSALGEWKLFLNEEDYYIQDPEFSVTGTHEYLVRFVPNNDLYYGPGQNITLRIYGKVNNYNDIQNSATTAFGPYELDNGEYVLTYSTIIPTTYSSLGTWTLVDSNHDPINAASETFTAEGDYTYYVKFVPNDANKYGPEVEVTVSVVEPVVAPSTLSAEDVAVLKNDLGMGPSDETATITFNENDGMYSLSGDLPTPSLSVAGTLHLYYNDGDTDTEFESGDELTEDPTTTYTWFFIYDITDDGYEDYRVNATATV